MKTEREKEKIEKAFILESLNWRYATKVYDKTRKISAEDWKILEESLRLAPSSYGLQPYKFIVITDEKLREKLKPAAYNQPQITAASHLVVFAYKKTLTDADIENFITRLAEVRGTSREALAEYEKMIKSSVRNATESSYIESWNSRQVYIALGFLLETAALLGLDATPMEGFDAAQFNEILGLEDYSAVVLAAVGYREEGKDWLAKLPKFRFPKEQLFDRR